MAGLIIEKQEYIKLSSEGFPGPAPDGSTLHFVDTGDQYVSYDGSWEPDRRLIRALELASLT